MNLLNRVLVALMMMLIILCASATIIVLAVYQGDIIGFFRIVANAYPPGVGLETEVIVGVGVVAAILAILAGIVLWLEVMPSSASAVRVQGAGGARAVLTTDAISQRIRHDAESIPDVRGARPIIWTDGSVVDVRLDLRLAPESSVPPLVAAVDQLVRESLDQRMGVRVRKLAINVRHEVTKKGASSASPGPSGPGRGLL
ncbi:MAG: alkaline shock response membrane anchor protein AmaP [Dehalococcoidia bacterium]|nr:alkaline shock response membrane anchor protein AmaP [Dehalococcoidia bacterium]